MLDICAGLAATLAVSLYRSRTLGSVAPLLVGLVVAAVVKLALRSRTSSTLSTARSTVTFSSSTAAAAVSAAEARHALVLARMKRDQEALMAAVARLEALAAGAEGSSSAEGRRRR